MSCSPPQTNAQPGSRQPGAIFLVLVALSGLAALVYQVAWTRRLTVVFGASTYAVATVLAAFLGGLALGAWVLGGPLDRSRRPLRVYAWLEAGIGVYAFAFPALLEAANRLWVVLGRAAEASSTMQALLRAVLTGLLLLPPTFLMGGTLPAMCRTWIRRDATLSRDLGFLYAFNTLGAAVGSLLAGFVLLARFGLHGSIYVAGGLNLLLSGWALWLARGESAGADAPAPTPAEGAGAPPRLPDAAVRLVLVAMAVSGFTALGYEVLWVRALVTMLHTGFTYAFSLMLGTFLFGLVLGSLIYARFFARHTSTLLQFARAQFVLGGWALASVWLLGQVPFLERAAAGRGWLGSEYTWTSWIAEMTAASLLIMLVPTTLMGICFPLAARLVVGGVERVGRGVGKLYAFNTVGSILGSLVAGFLLAPHLGTLNAIALLAVLNLLLAVVLAWAGDARRWERGAVVAFTAAAIVLCLVVTPRSYLRHALTRWRGGQLLYFAEDVIGVVEIYHEPSAMGGAFRRLFVNGTSYASTAPYARRYHKLLGHLPVLLHAAPERALMIAFGTGMTAGALARYKEVREIDCVDLSSAVLGGAGWFAGSNGKIAAYSKVRLLVEDGRNHLLLSDRPYDLITLEPPPPRFAGVANLYSRDFYALCRARLRPGGVVAQWIPMQSHTEEEMRALIRAFIEVFPNSTLWVPVQRDAIIIGGLDPPDVSLSRIRARMAQPRVAADLADIDIERPEALLASLMAYGPGLATYVGDVRPVTDDRPSIEFFVGQPLVEKPDHLEKLLPSRLDPAGLGAILRTGPEVPANVERYFRAMGHFYQGTVLGERGDASGRAREWRAALELEPGSPFFRRLVGQVERLGPSRSLGRDLPQEELLEVAADRAP